MDEEKRKKLFGAHEKNWPYIAMGLSALLCVNFVLLPQALPPWSVFLISLVLVGAILYVAAQMYFYLRMKYKSYSDLQQKEILDRLEAQYQTTVQQYQQMQAQHHDMMCALQETLTKTSSDLHDLLISIAEKNENQEKALTEQIIGELKKELQAVAKKTEGDITQNAANLSSAMEGLRVENRQQHETVQEKLEASTASICTAEEKHSGEMQGKIIELFGNHQTHSDALMSAAEQKLDVVQSALLSAGEQNVQKLKSGTQELREDTKQWNEALRQKLEETKTQVCEKVSVAGEAMKSAEDHITQQIIKETQTLRKEEMQQHELVQQKVDSAREAILLAEAANAKQLLNGINEMREGSALETARILDSVDNVEESSGKRYNLIYNQMQDFSKATRANIQNLEAKIADLQVQFTDRKKLTAIQTLLEEIRKNEGAIDDTAQRIQARQESNAAYLNNLHVQLTLLTSQIELLKKTSDQQDNAASALNPNRTDTITDKETGLTVLNKYENGRLTSSEMKKNGRTVYLLQYGDKGQISKSTNYDDKGQVVTEMTYHANGQVKERVETIRKNNTVKTERTTFDSNGNRLH